VDALIGSIKKEAAERNANVQYVLTSRRWTNELDEVVKSIINPEVIMQSGLELLPYSEMAPNIHAVTPATRNAFVLELLRGKCCKSMVCCSSAEEAEHLGSFLISFGVTNVLVASKQDPTAINGINYLILEYLIISFDNLLSDLRNTWKKVTDPTQCPVMVTTDEVLVHLEIDSAALLIHYTLPAVQYKFNYRLVTVQGNLPNKFAKVKSKVVRKLKIIIVIMLG
jgi:hypothetical protein